MPRTDHRTTGMVDNPDWHVFQRIPGTADIEGVAA